MELKYSTTYYNYALDVLKSMVLDERKRKLVSDSSRKFTGRVLHNRVEKYKQAHPETKFHTLLRIDGFSKLSSITDRQLDEVGTYEDYQDSPHSIEGRKVYFFNANNLKGVYDDRVVRIETIRNGREMEGQTSRIDSDILGAVVVLMPETLLYSKDFRSKISFEKSGYYNKQLGKPLDDALLESAVAPEVLEKCEYMDIMVDIVSELEASATDMGKRLEDYSRITQQFVVRLMDNTSELQQIVATEIARTQESEEGKAPEMEYSAKLKKFIYKHSRYNPQAFEDTQTIETLEEYNNIPEVKPMLREFGVLDGMRLSETSIVYASVTGLIEPSVIDAYLLEKNAPPIAELTERVSSAMEDDVYIEQGIMG